MKLYIDFSDYQTELSRFPSIENTTITRTEKQSLLAKINIQLECIKNLTETFELSLNPIKKSISILNISINKSIMLSYLGVSMVGIAYIGFDFLPNLIKKTLLIMHCTLAFYMAVCSFADTYKMLLKINLKEMDEMLLKISSTMKSMKEEMEIFQSQIKKTNFNDDLKMRQLSHELQLLKEKQEQSLQDIDKLLTSANEVIDKHSKPAVTFSLI